MGPVAISVERFSDHDFPDLTHLAAASPEGHPIRFATELLVPPTEMNHALGIDGGWYVARMDGVLVGAGSLAFTQLQYEGAIRPAARLANLMVHPRYRRQGVGTALAQHRIQEARARIGPSGVVVAAIPRGSTAALSTAHTWQNSTGRPFASATVRLGPPRRQVGEDVTVRRATREDLPQIVDGLNSFWSSANFFRPPDSSQLQLWLPDLSDLEAPRVYLVAEAEHGRIAAGLGLTYLAPYVASRVVSMPVGLTLLNLLVHAIPRGGRVHQVDVDWIFFGEQDLAAAQQLWEVVKRDWTRGANALTLSFDPAGPLSVWAQTVRLRHGVMMDTAVAADVNPDPSRPLAPWVL